MRPDGGGVCRRKRPRSASIRGPCPTSTASGGWSLRGIVGVLGVSLLSSSSLVVESFLVPATTTRTIARRPPPTLFHGHVRRLAIQTMSSSTRKNQERSVDQDYQDYDFENSIQSFNMDLHNLAQEDPQKAQDALEIMEDLYHSNPESNLRPDSASYTIVMEGWCYGGIHKDDHSLVGEESGDQEYNSYPSPFSSLTKRSSATTTSFTALKVQELLDHMEQAPHLQPNEVCYLLACQQWADAVADETPSGRNVQRAQELLDRLLLLQAQEEQQEMDEYQDEDHKGDDSQVLVSPKGIRQSSRQALAKQRLRRTATTTPPVRRRTIPISTKLYSIVLEAWCRRVGKVPHAMDRVEQLLKDMEDAAATGSAVLLPRPNVLTYTSVIGAFARSRQRDLATRAMALLPRMKVQGVQPDMVAYTSILNCWAKAFSREERLQAHTQALAILQEMEDLYTQFHTKNEEEQKNGSKKDIGGDDDGDDYRYHVKPNAITYATAIKAIGNSLADNAATLLESVLKRMYQLTEEGIIHVPPTVETYNAVIMSLASLKTGSREARARRAEEWLQDMIRRSQQEGENAVAPNVRTWGAVLKAWADSGRTDAGEQAQRVLDQMEQWYAGGKSSVKPNVVCYTTVMNAWARGSSKVALKRVERILKHMEDEYAETGDIRVRPNKISYISVMDAYGRKLPKRQAAVRAQAIVDRMMKLYALDQGYDRPTRIVLNALINAYSKSDDRNAAAQAEKIFRWMEAQYRAGDDYVRPDEVTLCGVLNAWANHASNGGALRAQEILDHTESMSLEERGFAHSIVCYNILIKAWGRSRAPDSVQRARQILQKLEAKCKEGDSRIRPDVTTYSSVINCCAYYAGETAGCQQALEVALETFSKIQREPLCEDGPNNITFGTVFKAIAKLMPFGTERETLVESLFQQCTVLGQVDSFVLSQVKAAGTLELYRKLVLDPARLSIPDESNYEKILKALPRPWSKNIVAWDA